MKRNILKTIFCSLFLIAFALFLPFIFSQQASASDTNLYIEDHAGLFTEAQVNELTKTASDLYAKDKLQIIVLTVKTTDGLSRKDFVEKYYDSKGFKNSYPSTLIMLISMESGNRGINIQGYGKAKDQIKTEYCSSIIDAVKPYLSSGSYEKAVQTYYQKAEYYNNKKSIITYTWFQLLIALAIGGIVVGIMAYNSGTKMTTNQSTYIDYQNSRVLAKRDVYLRTTITSVPKPKSSDSNSDSSGTSDGGSSHSGSDSSF